jgi:hypothetical protein
MPILKSPLPGRFRAGLKFKDMKKKSVVFALIIAAFVSVTSGCYVEGGYGYRYHHYHHYRGY